MTTEQNSGSPKGESIYLAIGFLRRPHGVSGEIIMDLHTDFPQRIKSGRKVLIGEKHQPLTFDTVRPHADGLLVRRCQLSSDGFCPAVIGRCQESAM